MLSTYPYEQSEVCASDMPCAAFNSQGLVIYFDYVMGLPLSIKTLTLVYAVFEGQKARECMYHHMPIRRRPCQRRARYR